LRYAKVVAKQINAVVRSIPRFPRAGRIVPEYNNPNIRERFYKSYRIIYKINDEIIEIVNIVHSARLLSNLE